MSNTAIYAGSFDPLTLGHAWVLWEGVSLFDKVIVAVGINPSKKYWFTGEERAAMVQEWLNDKTANGDRYKNVEVEFMGQEFLFQFAEKKKANTILRGVRTAADFEYEKAVASFNARMGHSLRTVFLMPPDNLVNVSSSFIRGLVGYKDWQSIVPEFVPASVFPHILRRANSTNI